MKTEYISSTEFIKGAKESPLAKSECSDCVVRAIASATEMDYDSAHQFVKEKFKRKNLFVGDFDVFVKIIFWTLPLNPFLYFFISSSTSLAPSL